MSGTKDAPPCTVDPELPMPIRGLRADAYHSQQTVYENDFWNSRWRGSNSPPSGG